MESKGTILVTGGAGFIGSHLCDALISQGYSLLCVDNLSTGNKKNIEHLFSHPSFTFIEHDVIKPLPDIPIPQYIFHLASPASVVDYQNLPEETALVNSVGTRNLLILSRHAKARFLFASTSEIYGDPKEHPQKETYWGNVNPNGIRACYDESKRFGEMITMLYQRTYALDTRIIRIFNTYGPRMRPTDGRVISNFITQAINNEPITVYGTGNQTRSFCYVSDLVDGMVAVMFQGKNGEVYNLGNPEEYTINDLAKKIQEMTKTSSQIVYKKLPQDDPVKRRPDITKTKNEFGWEPNVGVGEGLQKTIEYYKSIT